MNWTIIFSTVIPAALQLLNDPAFQSVIKAVEALFTQNVASGTPASTATAQASGLLGAAAMLHLTGNPVTDFNAWIASLHPTAVPAVKPAPITPVPGTPMPVTPQLTDLLQKLLAELQLTPPLPVPASPVFTS